uniref:Uncharacterized protein n=1 Tax=Tanacetum cinerariifolium TaxID=118510 RepID=A0A699IA62_TANCI|nr:hypothetical protein [Tanacetum cinerariifolium]
MNPVAAKQVALNNALVSPEKILKIERCNARIKFSKPQREETYQVTLDSLKLSPCYPAFLITTEVPEEEFMFQADNREISLTRKKHMPYPSFTKVIINHFISKDKTISRRNMINLHTIRDDTLLGFVVERCDCIRWGFCFYVIVMIVATSGMLENPWKGEVIRILAGQIIQFAAMAD